MSEQPTPAGWYPDPQMAGTQRYWDGSSWSDHIAPMSGPSASDAQRAATHQSQVESWGVILAIFLPIVGFIIGLTLLNKPGSRGLAIVGLSIGCAVVWYWVFASGVLSS